MSKTFYGINKMLKKIINEHKKTILKVYRINRKDIVIKFEDACETNVYIFLYYIYIMYIITEL